MANVLGVENFDGDVVGLEQAVAMGAALAVRNLDARDLRGGDEGVVVFHCGGLLHEDGVARERRRDCQRSFGRSACGEFSSPKWAPELSLYQCFRKVCSLASASNRDGTDSPQSL